MRENLIIYSVFSLLKTICPLLIKQYTYLIINLILKVLKKAGAGGKSTVFLFNDNQIKDESFVEDINMILNTGDVPNIYAADEKAEILEKMQSAARELVIAI